MAPARIMIVEDDRVVARDIAQQMTRIGHTVVGMTARGEDVVSLARETSADLVLMDIRLEGQMDGIDAARQLRESMSLPVVFLTAYADAETVRRATAAEPFGYVLKPFDETQLRTVVEMALYKHQAERRLRDSEARYAVTLSSIGDGVIATDANLCIEFLNPVAASLTGWTREAALKRPLGEVFEVLNELTRERLADCTSLPPADSRYKEVPDRIVLISRDKREIPLESSASPIIDEHGQVRGVVLVFRDVTQKRRAEEAEILRETNARLEMAMFGTNVAIWEIELPGGDYRQGTARFSNVWEWLGYFDKEPVLDYNNYMQVVHPEERRATEKAMTEYLAHGEGFFELENRFLHRDGSDRWALVRGKVRRDQCDKPASFFGSLVDITDLKRAERQLRESEQRFRGTFENAAVGIAHCDLDGRFLRVNQRACEIVGYDSVTLQGMRLKDLMDEAFTVGSLQQFFTLKVGEAAHYSEEKPVVRPDGSRGWINLSLALQDDSAGQTSHMIAIIQDISARKELEDAVRVARDAAESANKAKDQFLANISHELRTPLNGILGYAQILRRDNTLGERQLSSLGVIEQSGEHLLMLINDLLDFSRIGAGKLDLQTNDVPLDPFLNVITEMVEVRAHQKGLVLNYVAATELPKVIRVDEKRLRQVLLNLLINAVKFTDQGEISLDVMQVSTGRLRFEVKDTGIGVSPDRLESIFKPFEQVGDLTRRSAGAGLGLAISQQLVRMMGSDIHVESAPGRGSVFWFELEAPASDMPPVPAILPIGVTHYEGRERHILVLDDVAANRALLVDALERSGFRVSQGADGREGLHKALACSPDLIILDTVMPVMGGIEMLSHIRQSAALRNIPVIAVSADASRENARSNLQAGADAFLEKPLDLQLLLKEISALLSLSWASTEFGRREEDTDYVLPPPKEMALLHRFALLGSMRDIIGRTDHLIAQDPVYAPFAKRLRGLAMEYETQALLSLIEKQMGKST